MWNLMGYSLVAGILNKLMGTPLPPCPGPLEWFDSPTSLRREEDGTLYMGGIMWCHRCAYIVTTGNYHDKRHNQTMIIRKKDPA